MKVESSSNDAGTVAKEMLRARIADDDQVFEVFQYNYKETDLVTLYVQHSITLDLYVLYGQSQVPIETRGYAIALLGPTVYLKNLK